MIKKIIRRIVSSINKPIINVIKSIYNNEIVNEEKKMILIAKSILFSNQFNDITLNSKNNRLHQFEFKVFSQFGDDGIIQFLINYLDIHEKTFVEFGVTDYIESNTRFLLMNNNWSGLVIDGSIEEVLKIKNSYYYWQFDLNAEQLWVTKDNIDNFIVEKGFDREIGLLHIDLDGNDYWIWDAIKSISPVIFIAEYNSVFGILPWTIPYSESFYRTDAHYSNLYWGSGLGPIYNLSKNKGFSFIGCNSAGNNAYFVRNDKLKDLTPISLEEGIVISKYRESRNQNGHLDFVAGKNRLDKIKGMQIFNVEKELIEII
jgi:hypothetical protein